LVEKQFVVAENGRECHEFCTRFLCSKHPHWVEEHRQGFGRLFKKKSFLELLDTKNQHWMELDLMNVQPLRKDHQLSLTSIYCHRTLCLIKEESKEKKGLGSYRHHLMVLLIWASAPGAGS
jgi:hypothetical protein